MRENTIISLNTDFYQLSMIAAYVYNNKANDITGFEGFFRHIKKPVNAKTNFYIFDGEKEVDEYINQVKIEIKTVEFLEQFLKLVMPKVTSDKELVERTIRDEWQNIKTDFEYNIIPNGTIVYPHIPVFQFNGPRWIGQLIETYVTNIYNGKTALATLKYLKNNDLLDDITDDEFNFLNMLMQDDNEALSQYARILDNTAYDFRMAAGNKILLEAAFRRCPSFTTAKMASEAALINGWNGTSNTALVLNGRYDDSKIGGTMAHAWVMSFKTEEEAFIAWDKIFPGTTMLIDTYDVENAAKLIDRLVTLGKITLPNEVRIDSDPLDTYTMIVNNIFGGKVGIFVSGDMDIEKFNSFDNRNIPYTKAMAGTKYCYASKLVEKLNSGFVYKLVQYKDNDLVIRPEKKATGKQNYSGLKLCEYDESTNVLRVIMGTEQFGFKNISKINKTTTVEFTEYE